MLDLVYRHAMRARRRWYARRPEARRRLARPVVAIGNLALGGTGKTPLVAALAARLVAAGERPAILSRGHGRRSRGTVVVSDGARVLAGVAASGDEPQMLAAAVPGAAVVVGASRHEAGRVAEEVLGCTVHVVDDGFQHVQLARDLDVLVTVPGEIERGRVLPFGRLREGPEAAADADVLVVVGAAAAEAAAEAARLGVGRGVGARRVLEGVRPLAASRPIDPAALVPGRAAAVAVAGLARPRRFFEMLRAQGWTLARTVALGDHHWYGPRDVARLAAALVASGASLILTTDKDAVKLEALAPLPFAIARVPMRLELDPSPALDELVTWTLDRGRGAAAAGTAP